MPRDAAPQPEPTDAKAMHDLLRQLPSVDALIDNVIDQHAPGDVSRRLVADVCRQVIEHCRQQLRHGKTAAGDLPSLGQLVMTQLEADRRPALAYVINATGILLHTGLGRAPLAADAARCLADVAQHYAPVEIDMHTGQRNRRADVVRDLLCELTNSESATVVNNNAAATLLTLAAVAAEKQVIVSRGELIEIGGSFRLPDVMQISRATLREVGTTNRTRLADYTNALGPDTGAILKVHPSNFRVIGFTESTDTQSLAKLCHEHNLPLIDDIGSGALHPMEPFGLRDEPVASQSIAHGADLVLFSGDKLLAGPQAGIIVGKHAWIERIETHPLYRAFRVDKLTLAALARTLQIHRDPDQAMQTLPLYAMLSLSPAQLHQRGRSLTEKLADKVGQATVDVVESEAYLGGGSTPDQAIASVALRLTPPAGSEQQWATQLRQSDPPVLARVTQASIWFDLRSVMEDQLDALTTIIINVASSMAD